MMQDPMSTPDVVRSSAGKEPLVLRSETVRSVEVSEQQAARAGVADVRPFHEVARNAHPGTPPAR